MPSAYPAIKTRKKVLTYDDYVALTPPDSGEFELQNGKIIQMASPSTRHQDVVVELTSQMHTHAKKHKLGKVLTAPMDTQFDKFNTFQPDILFVSAERAGIIGEKKIDGAPDLVVEVLSESNSQQEMSFKKHIYESHAVREYWVVNLRKNTVTQYTNIEGELMPVKIHSGPDVVESQVLAGFKISVQDIFEP